jgi:hypothetical protein
MPADDEEVMRAAAAKYRELRRGYDAAEYDDGEIDFTRAGMLTPQVERAIEDAFELHEWNAAQVRAGEEIRRALIEAVKMIVMFAPPCPDRSSAIRKLREARQDANSAISHGGKY